MLGQREESIQKSRTKETWSVGVHVSFTTMCLFSLVAQCVCSAKAASLHIQHDTSSL